MSSPYTEFPLADRDAGSPMDFPFWDLWRKRFAMHRQRPAVRLPVSLTGLAAGPASGQSTPTEIWVPPWARQYVAGFRVQATATTGFGMATSVRVRLHVGTAAAERVFALTQSSPSVDEVFRLVVDLNSVDLDSNATWKVSYELGANVLSGAAIETAEGSGRHLAQWWGTP